mmetsp:Transcript_63400/g.174439  ORF Transcript_63400/g.174439 Transcript_63400/m.174439 type:complete len:374 (+) Transcript_63400:928-2049(+)
MYIDPTGVGRRESVWDDVVICREKIASLLEYMFVMSSVVPDADLERLVTFELLERPLDAFKSRLELGQLAQASSAPFRAAETIVLHQSRMENPMVAENADMAIPGLAAQRSYDSPLQGEGPAAKRKSAAAQRWGFTNFANMVYGYGEMIPSCTQEEVMQVCCPEFNVGLLHFGTMADDQVVVVRNVRRTSDYEGYMSTFQFKPLAPDPLAPSAHDGAPPRVGDIITIDAVRSMHYGTEQQLRDLNKVELAFGGARRGGEQRAGDRYHVSSGRWGCGIFGGYVPHKVVQQALGAHMSNTKVYISRYTSRFSETEELLRNETAKALQAMEGKDAPTIWAALQVAEQVGSGTYNPDFVKIFCGKLSDASHAYENSF